MKPKILIIDDEPSVLSSFQLYLQDFPVELVVNTSPNDALRNFGLEPYSYACAFIDYLFPNNMGRHEATGHKVACELKEMNPSLYVVIMSGDESKEALRTWLSTGIEKFVHKPLKEDMLYAFTEHALTLFEERNPQTENKIINHHGLIGVSDHTKRVVKLIKRFAPSDESVLISGETGTGKELVARAIHKQSPRARKPFVAINCAAITENLFESELFGHVKGAFTGADRNKPGKFREAEGGTLFLDEIHHLTLNQQAKILRVIQEKVVVPVGDKQEYRVDFRLLCASKPHLREQSIKNDFLIDLFFRISSLNLEILPLRSRPDDIDQLIRFFQKENEEKLGTFKRFSPTALKCLKEYSWPGNIRELQKIVRELYFIVDRSTIKHTDLPESILQGTSVVEIETGMTMGDLDEQQRQQKRLLIQSVMKEAENNKTQAAKLLGMKRSTFIWLMQDLEIYNFFDNKHKQETQTERIKETA